MAALNSWQKISRVLGGDWGDGKDGAATISSDPNTRATVTGSATSTSATAGSTAFANGDLVMLHQTQGTGAGQWEINRVASGGGTTSLTMQVALQYTYGTGAQIIKIPRYTTATVAAHSVTAWNGSTGGIWVAAFKQKPTMGGNVTVNGGFRGGAWSQGNNTIGYQGEGLTGAGVQSRSANGIGGGAGQTTGTNKGSGAGGGGGGHATQGATLPLATSGSSGVHSEGVQGGTTADSTDGTTMVFGGGGAGCAVEGGATGANGSAGGGIAIIFCPDVDTSTYGFITNGTVGGSAAHGGGGGGAGGYTLFVVGKGTFGTAKNTSTGGGVGVAISPATNNNPDNGGSGGVGRIAIHHSGTVTGTTNPTFTDITDTTLRDIAGGSFIFNLL